MKQTEESIGRKSIKQNKPTKIEAIIQTNELTMWKSIINQTEEELSKERIQTKPNNQT